MPADTIDIARYELGRVVAHRVSARIEQSVTVNTEPGARSVFLAVARTGDIALVEPTGDRIVAAGDILMLPAAQSATVRALDDVDATVLQLRPEDVPALLAPQAVTRHHVAYGLDVALREVLRGVFAHPPHEAARPAVGEALRELACGVMTLVDGRRLSRWWPAG